ncbi:hypothetical protein CL619_02255 [archaeon]|nr:hypothetical protein [archaeon]|tara:strand:- start:3546 stop:3740 length:195 start_codon:yes stop_codon:yes gene_type:complete
MNDEQLRAMPGVEYWDLKLHAWEFVISKKLRDRELYLNTLNFIGLMNSYESRLIQENAPLKYDG